MIRPEGGQPFAEGRRSDHAARQLLPEPEHLRGAGLLVQTFELFDRVLGGGGAFFLAADGAKVEPRLQPGQEGVEILHRKLLCHLVRGIKLRQQRLGLAGRGDPGRQATAETDIGKDRIERGHGGAPCRGFAQR